MEYIANDMVALTKSEYEKLLHTQLHMDILEARGVDNWHGFCGVPRREDYDTEEEYDKAIDRACEGI